MDEVDFTILAATSVLGDMIDKCPPAEACRDAFDRMSKATVQMCMSTTGFSSSAQGLNSRSHNSSHRSHKGENHDPSPTEYFGQSSSTQFATSNSRSQNNRPSHVHRHSSNDQSRSKAPQFDMGLNDLFPVPSGNTGLQDQNQNQNQTQPQYQTSSNGGSALKNEYGNEAFGIPMSQVHSPSDYAMSPTTTIKAPNSNNSGMDTSSIDPSLLPSPPNATIQPFNPSDPSLMYANNGFDFDFSNMDFLQGAAPGGLGSDAVGQGGMDLGFGLGWEGMDHDFSDGNQLDLFDGFFFGQ